MEAFHQRAKQRQSGRGMRVKPRGCSVPRGWALAGACALGGVAQGALSPGAHG